VWSEHERRVARETERDERIVAALERMNGHLERITGALAALAEREDPPTDAERAVRVRTFGGHVEDLPAVPPGLGS
jgi:hypothetical protein